MTPNLPKPPQISTFRVRIAFCIFVLDELTDFNFGEQVDRIKFQPMGDKPSLKGAWSRHVTNFKFVV